MIQKALLGLMKQSCDDQDKFEISVNKNPPGNPPGIMKINDNVCKVKIVNE